MMYLERMMLSRVCISSFLIALTVAGCATKAPAPVAERTRPGSSAQSKPESPVPVPSTPVARPGYYIVKPGDTLIRIALDQGQNYRDIAAWSGLENANLIEVGQELRVRPPESAAVSRPVSSNGGEVRPAAAVVNSDGVRREPKGGKVAYSEQAWALAQKPEAPVVLAKIDAKPEVRP